MMSEECREDARYDQGYGQGYTDGHSAGLAEGYNDTHEKAGDNSHWMWLGGSHPTKICCDEVAPDVLAVWLNNQLILEVDCVLGTVRFCPKAVSLAHQDLLMEGDNGSS